MLVAILAFTNLILFYTSKFYTTFSGIKFGNEQISLSLSGIIILLLLIIGILNFIEWNKYHKKYIKMWVSR